MNPHNFLVICLSTLVSADHPLHAIHNVLSDPSEGIFDSISHRQASEFSSNPSNPDFLAIDTNPGSVFPANPVAG